MCETSSEREREREVCVFCEWGVEMCVEREREVCVCVRVCVRRKRKNTIQ